MKKSEKNLLNAVYEKIEDNTSFERIINKSGVDLGANGSKQAFKISIWRKSLAYALTFIAIIALIIPLSLFFIKGDGVEKIVISNLNDLIVEYQLNGSFIASGISVQKQFKNGSLEECLQDEIEIDYSAFKEGVAGEYPIVVSLKSNNKIKTEYTVKVTDDYLCGIEVDLGRSVYFVGEEIAKEDITVRKVLISKDVVGEDFSGEISKENQSLTVKKEGKPTEYSIKQPDGFLVSEGVYSLNVVLNTNQKFNSSCTVLVQDLSNLYLDGLYAFTQDELLNAPTYLAFAITQNFITSYYSEVILEGRITKQIDNGQIVIGDAWHSQKALYNAINGTLTFIGSADDPNFTCFKLGLNDYLINLKGDSFGDGRYYVAKNGKLSKGTVEYLKQAYGGLWKDEQKKEAVDENTAFTKDTTLFVGASEQANGREYCGVFYDSNGEIFLTVKEGGLYIGSSSTKKEYTAQSDGADTLLRIGADMERFYYRHALDVIDVCDGNDAFIKRLRRYNSEKQAIVTMNRSYGVYRYVVNKGESLSASIVQPINISVFQIKGYNGEPIYEDTTFDNVTVWTIKMIDIDDVIYGDLGNYFVIKNAWCAGKTSTESYYYEAYNDYFLSDSGSVVFSKYDGLTNVVTMLCSSDGGSKFNIELNRTQKEIKMGEASYLLNEEPFNGAGFVGSYLSQSGKTIEITNQGKICFNQSGFLFCYLLSVKDNQYVIKSYYGDQHVTLTLLEDNGSFSLTWQGESYFLLDNQPIG
ncbi:MAG: hypothetical protein E7339_04105 [Clostridiales bacterium]|nr:hypothetical protein [Clostridiales bacterium]